MNEQRNGELTTAAADEVRVDPEFAALIPPLSREERHRLEVSLLVEGCRDDLVVWKGEGLLLDGHNRRELCRQHGIPFRVRLVELADRVAARAYLVTLQLGRRNLTREAGAYLRGKRYQAEKQPLGGNRTAAGAVDLLAEAVELLRLPAALAEALLA